VLYDAILARVVGDDGKDPAIGKLVTQNWKRRRKRVHLIVHGNPHGLKYSREITGAGT
jgi:hypothetical protein